MYPPLHNGVSIAKIEVDRASELLDKMCRRNGIPTSGPYCRVEFVDGVVYYYRADLVKQELAQFSERCGG